MENDTAQVITLLEPFRPDIKGMVVESTYNWYWLVDALVNAGFDVKLANTATITQYDGLKYSGDEHDTRHLAHLLRLGLLRFGYIFPPEFRAVRDLARKRLQMVRTRTLHVLALETMVARQTGGRLGRHCLSLGRGTAPTLFWGGEESPGRSREDTLDPDG